MSSGYYAKGDWYRLRDLRLFVEPYKAGVPVWRIAEDTGYSDDHIRAALKAAGAWKGKSCPK
mgnify:CR=1 FL=1